MIFLEQSNILHLDIKPENIMIVLNEEQKKQLGSKFYVDTVLRTPPDNSESVKVVNNPIPKKKKCGARKTSNFWFCTPFSFSLRMQALLLLSG